MARDSRVDGAGASASPKGRADLSTHPKSAVADFGSFGAKVGQARLWSGRGEGLSVGTGILAHRNPLWQFPRAVGDPRAHRFSCCRSSVVEHPLGKGEVVSSILTGSTMLNILVNASSYEWRRPNGDVSVTGPIAYHRRHDCTAENAHDGG
jgi:hypothetical protein